MEQNNMQKKTARISFNTKSSVKGDSHPTSIKMKGRKDLQLNMAKVHTPHAGSKQSKLT